MIPSYCVMRAALLSALLVLSACGGGGGGGDSTPASTSRTVSVSWHASPETAVNSAGGGYKLYYSGTSGFALGAATMVNVPYVTPGPSAPTTRQLSLVPGTYYFKVAAYSGINPAGSALSDQITVVVP